MNQWYMLPLIRDWMLDDMYVATYEADIFRLMDDMICRNSGLSRDDF